MPTEARYDAVLEEWVTVATHRQDRTHLRPQRVPAVPVRAGRATEIPDEDYDVVVFENRFPSFAGTNGTPVVDGSAGDVIRRAGVGRAGQRDVHPAGRARPRARRLLRRLDATGIDYVVMLTADHGGARHARTRAPAGRGGAAPGRSGARRQAMGRRSAGGWACSRPVLFGDCAFGDMYVDRALPPRRARVLDEAVRAYRAHPQVAAVFTRAEIAAAPSPVRPARYLDADRARPRLVRRRALRRFPGRCCSPRVTPIFDTARLCRHPRQPLGL